MTLSGMGEDMGSQTKHWMVTLQEVFYPALAAVGIPCKNCTLSRSSALYLMAISVADNFVLMFIVILELSLKYHQQEPFWSYEPWCSLRDIFNYGAYNASTWLVVLFTVERFIAIHTWKIKPKICNQRCAAWTIAATFVFSHLFAIPHYWSNTSVHDNNQTRCIYNPEAPTRFIHALVWIQTLQAYIFPFLIILTVNGPLLLTISMSFVLLSVTRAITQIILRTTELYTLDRNDYSHQINIAADAGTMLCLSNAAANMYLYVCTQSRFRHEFSACIYQASFYFTSYFFKKVTELVTKLQDSKSNELLEK
uniref:G-protein coupled receptors family 1 profile domain-containing protein n=1 Tax=Neolamprologus brichardi TaxID=32507 RepID=A0A3Q4MYF2_NEOBR